MSCILEVWIDDETEQRLKAISNILHRTIEDLAGCAVAEAALDWEKSNKQLLQHYYRQKNS